MSKHTLVCGCNNEDRCCYDHCPHLSNPTVWQRYCFSINLGHQKKIKQQQQKSFSSPLTWTTTTPIVDLVWEQRRFFWPSERSSADTAPPRTRSRIYNPKRKQVEVEHLMIRDVCAESVFLWRGRLYAVGQFNINKMSRMQIVLT